MVDYSHLELFHDVGRGAHRHDDTPVTVEVMGVNVLQLLHKFRQHGGNRGTPLVSSLSGRLSEEVDQSNQKTLEPLGTKASEDSMKKADVPRSSAMVKVLWRRSQVEQLPTGNSLSFTRSQSNIQPGEIY